MRVFSWGQGDEGVRGEWSEVLGGAWGGAGFGGGLWECEAGFFESRQGQRGLWVVGEVL